MHITIHCPNPLFTRLVRNHFVDQGIECMICNNETEVALFDIDLNQVEFLISAFVKQFHLKNARHAATAA